MFVMPHCYGRVVHLRQLSTSCYHDAVAFGYRRVNVPPDGDLHPAVSTPSQAHERDVYVASAWNRRGDETHARELPALKRPEGRAPAQIIVAALNTYSAARRPDRVLREGEQVVDIRAATRAVFDGAADARRAIWL